ncbi:DUF4190 domain-containing protein [Niallia sp. 03133]|uniref:DUF4190 domain-containing protein n=1 Tax=Niallia sp. 03133 TaxID=3458060 RepID=UPI004043CDF0
MAENKSNEGYDLRDREQHGITNEDFLEETSAEIAAPAPIAYERDRDIDRDRDRDVEREDGGKGIGITALILSIISLFVWPILLGAVSIVLGFMARRRGALSLGTWAISLGAISIIIGIFIAPFF